MRSLSAPGRHQIKCRIVASSASHRRHGAIKSRMCLPMPGPWKAHDQAMWRSSVTPVSKFHSAIGTRLPRLIVALRARLPEPRTLQRAPKAPSASISVAAYSSRRPAYGREFRGARLLRAPCPASPVAVWVELLKERGRWHAKSVSNVQGRERAADRHRSSNQPLPLACRFGTKAVHPNSKNRQASAAFVLFLRLQMAALLLRQQSLT